MIELKGLQKVIQNNTVIDIALLQVADGEAAALVGPAGCGKEHLLKLLLGQSRPTMGSVRVAGIDPLTQKDAFSRKTGILFAEDNLYGRQSARSNLAFHCRLYSLPNSRAVEVLSQVGLADHADVKAEKLPVSLARRLAFGRAILHKPEVLILVEPFNRCDENSIELISRVAREIAGGGGTVLILGGDASQLGALCDTIYSLDQGRIVEARRPTEDQQTELPFKIPVRLEGKVVLVNPGDILYAVADEGNTYLQTREARLPIQLTLSELEGCLLRSGFFRAHRGYLVNLQHVKEVIQFTRNSFNLRLDDPAQTEIPLSKSAASELSQLLGF